MPRRRSSAAKDPMLTGFAFLSEPSSLPTDHLTDPETGKRPGFMTKPGGHIVHDLTGDYDVTLPSVATWEQGEWFDKMENPPNAFKANAFTWVVPGEGTPGNYLWRIYYLPEKVATGIGDGIPPHPMKWRDKTRREARSSWKSSSYDYDSWKKKDDQPVLPMGIRVRCVGCGHWFEVNDLGTHTTSCCPQLGMVDWAIACECCTSLDDTATVKDGYPRAALAKPEEAPVEESAEKPAAVPS